MSLRAIELQIAIPKTQDIGKMQEYLRERPQQEQAILAHSRHEQEQANRTRALESQETEKNGSERWKEKQAGKREGRQGSAEGKRIELIEGNLHPYVGHHIDVSL